MTDEQLIEKGKGWLSAKYPGYQTKTARERRVLAAAWLCDVVKPREATGNNDGAVVGAILQSCGLSTGHPWCAAAQHLVARVAVVSMPARHGASVIAGWVSWAKDTARLVPVAMVQRGDLLAADYGGGKGHIGIVIKKVGPVVYSIEGNTSAGAEGSQRDGQGMYRRMRLARFWKYGIRGD